MLIGHSVLENARLAVKPSSLVMLASRLVLSVVYAQTLCPDALWQWCSAALQLAAWCGKRGTTVGGDGCSVPSVMARHVLALLLGPPTATTSSAAHALAGLFALPHPIPDANPASRPTMRDSRVACEMQIGI